LIDFFFSKLNTLPKMWGYTIVEERNKNLFFFFALQKKERKKHNTKQTAIKREKNKNIKKEKRERKRIWKYYYFFSMFKHKRIKVVLLAGICCWSCGADGRLLVVVFAYDIP